jgi:cytochrome c oxidase assembly factor CtaG
VISLGNARPDIATHLGATAFSVMPTVLILGATALYVWGSRRVGRTTPDDPWSKMRTGAFLAAMALVGLAVESVIGAYDDTLFYDHMVQHLLLIMVAAPLVALAAPVELLVRSTHGPTHQAVVRALGSRVAGVVGHPLTGFMLYAVLVPAVHLTSLYDLTLTHELAHDNEHVLFLVVGYLFWRPVVAIEPSRHPLSPVLRVAYLLLAVPIDTFSGLALLSANHELFDAYSSIGRSWGPSQLEDLHAGGAIMWVAGDSLLALALIPVVVAWIRTEGLASRRLDARRGTPTVGVLKHPAVSGTSARLTGDRP